MPDDGTLTVNAPGETDQGDATPSLKRRDSRMWDWVTKIAGSSEPASRAGSLHGGNLFSWMGKSSPPSGSTPDSRGGSLHGGNRFGDSMPGSRGGSLHGGNRFGKLKQGSEINLAGMASDASKAKVMNKAELAMDGQESSSWLWVWMNRTPPASQPGSRNASAHGGNLFGSMFGSPSPTGGGPSPTGSRSGASEGDGSTLGMRRRSLSFLWNWGLYRPSPPQTPGSSMHGGNVFNPAEAAAQEGEGEEEEGAKEPAIMPPKALTRGNSIGSFMWDWGAMRPSPTQSPGGSQHGGNVFAKTQTSPNQSPGASQHGGNVYPKMQAEALPATME